MQDDLHLTLSQFSLALNHLLPSAQAPHDAICVDNASLRVHVLGPAGGFRFVLEFARARDFHLLTAILQKTGFIVKSIRKASTESWTTAPKVFGPSEDSKPRLSSITTLPGVGSLGSSSPSRSHSLDFSPYSDSQLAGTQVSQSPALYASQQGYSRSSPQPNDLSNTHVTVYNSALNPYNVFSKTARLDPYQPRESSPLRNGVIQAVLPTENPFPRASSTRLPAPLPSIDLLRQAVGRRVFQLQSTEDSQPSCEAPHILQPNNHNPAFGSEDPDSSIERSPASTTDNADANQSFESLLPPSRHLPFKETGRKRSADSSAAEEDLEMLQPSRPAKKTKLQPTASLAPKISSNGTSVSVMAKHREPSEQRKPNKRGRGSSKEERGDMEMTRSTSDSFRKGIKATLSKTASAPNAKLPPTRPVSSKRSKTSKQAVAKDPSSHPGKMITAQTGSPASERILRTRQSTVQNPSVQPKRAGDKSSAMSTVQRTQARPPIETDRTSKQTGSEKTKAPAITRRSLRIRRDTISSVAILQPSKARVNTPPPVKNITQVALVEGQAESVAPARGDMAITDRKRERKVQLAKKTKHNPRHVAEVVQAPAKQKPLASARKKPRVTTGVERAGITPEALLEKVPSTSPSATVPPPYPKTSVAGKAKVLAESLTAMSLRSVKASLIELEAKDPTMATAQSHRHLSRSVTATPSSLSELPAQVGKLARPVQPSIAMTSRVSSPVRPARPSSISPNIPADRTNLRKPILVTSATLKEVNGTADRFIDQYREDKGRGLDQRTLELYYGYQIVQAQTQYWFMKLAQEEGLL